MYNQQVISKFINSGKCIMRRINPESYIGSVVQSKRHGPYKINRIVGKTNHGDTIVEIEFLESGSKRDVILSVALRGMVRDHQYGLRFDRTYISNNHGEYIILSLQQSDNGAEAKALIKFLTTGHEKFVTVTSAKTGTVGDDGPIIPLDTNLLDPVEKQKRLLDFARKIWIKMHNRCYNPSNERFNEYGGIGVHVSDEWFDVNNFINDLPLLFQYDKWQRFPTIYQLDKDYLQQNIPKGQRIYSKETCVFLHETDNANLSKVEHKREGYTESEYFGVRVRPNGTYSTQIKINGTNYYLGTFVDEMAAANAYNYYYNRRCCYEHVPLLNDVLYMPPNEYIKYNVNVKTMADFVTGPRVMADFVKKKKKGK